MPLKCWAAGLGGCHGGWSGEHLVSSGIFEGPKISVEGFPWCQGRAVEIGLSALTSNILCRGHNSALSELDQTGIKAFRTLGEISRVAELRSHLPPGSWDVLAYEIDGNALERWCLKSAINLFSVYGKATQTEPRLVFVRAVFGLDTLPPPMGLYAAARIGEMVPMSRNIFFTPIWDLTNTPSAALFSFHGLRFVLWLNDVRPAEEMFDQIPGWQAPGLARYLSGIEFNMRGKRSQRLLIRWLRLPA